MRSNQKMRIVEAMATDEEIIDLARTVFLFTDNEQARQLAAYIITRLDPGHELEAVDGEVSYILAKMAADGELEFRFPNRYRKPKRRKNPIGRPPNLPTDPAGKKCTQCEEKKPWSEFSVARSKYDGHHSICKKCRNAEAANSYRARGARS